MVALFSPDDLSEEKSRRQRSHLRLVVDNGGNARSSPNMPGAEFGLRRPEIPQVRVGQSRRGSVADRVLPNRSLADRLVPGVEVAQTPVIVAAVAFVVFGFLFGIRVIQGSPDSSISFAQTEQESIGPQSGEESITVIGLGG